MDQAETGSREAHDLLIITDATGSMQFYLESLRSSLPKIIAMSALTGVFDRMGILAYRDYDASGELLEWSGWVTPSADTGDSVVTLVRFTAGLKACGNGDLAEAAKTGLARAYELMREDATTIVLFYTDAAPHTELNSNDNYSREQKALGKPKSYGGFGPSFTSWENASKLLSGQTGTKHCQIFSILDKNMKRNDGKFYHYLSTVSKGACFYLTKSSATHIAKVTVDIILAWMGIGKTGVEATEVSAKMVRYKDSTSPEDVAEAAKIEDQFGRGNFHASNTEELWISTADLMEGIVGRTPPVQQFDKRYKLDAEYRKTAAKHLLNIIRKDVSAIALNPVFGTLWRAVCNDRRSEHRDELVKSFSSEVERLGSPGEKQRMKKWLEESYDYTAEVLETIEDIPKEQRYPCVYLDPTMDFSNPGSQEQYRDIFDEDYDERAITKFRRDELLEISRSCDSKILRRLGRVLSRLSFADSPEKLPAHIANTKQTELTKIPLALASKEHGAKFWRMLLHIVVPGTLLSARPAALLAALAIKLGVKPLLAAAEAEMQGYRNNWSKIEIPETWSINCLSLLLSVDQMHREAKAIDSNGEDGLLNKTDRDLFNRLVSYKMLELNLQTTLTARVGWTPEKSSIPIGPVVVCRSCSYPRSVTIMGNDSQCGICLSEGYRDTALKESAINNNVTKDTTKVTPATWVECFIQTCRSQYVVYNPKDLRVRPKCHYCRQQSSLSTGTTLTAPWVECHKCLNRMIYPKEYRSGTIETQFECPACANGLPVVVDATTTAQALRDENGDSWLLRNDESKLQAPFSNRSLFHQLSAAGIDRFTELVDIFPIAAGSLQLTLDGKVVQNNSALLSELKSWITRRSVESVTCSLCFSSERRDQAYSACGRRGCKQLICAKCLSAWYGLNTAGRIINIAALACPFCRRTPTAKTLANYGMGIHAVGGLKDAVQEQGEWVYAWCVDCAQARRYLERVCARGAPPEVQRWSCEQCREERGEDWALRHEKKVEPKRRICPNQKCGVMVEKIDGCGHITCVCGADWCWFCGQIPYNDIYDHMADVHDTYYDPDEIEGLTDDEEDVD